MKIVYENPSPPTNYIGWTFLGCGLIRRKYWAVLTLKLNAIDPTIRLTRSVAQGIPYDAVPVPGPDEFITIVKKAEKHGKGFFLPADGAPKVFEREWTNVESALSGHKSVVYGLITGMLRIETVWRRTSSSVIL